MPTVSIKRQITLPPRECREVGFEPGDECEIFVADKSIMIVPQNSNSIWGCLAHVKGDDSISDDESLLAAIESDRERVDSQS